ncbi:hypothetical protein [Mucilaginibacter sp.]|uniref:hypothetical protein n=1 Tax=Mucilaginibacter sp. TaxID=1882438 RepID=UPI002ED60990
MKKVLLFLSLFLFIQTKGFCQYSTPSDGHELKWVNDYIEVFRSEGGKPVKNHPKMWNHKLWFYRCIDQPEDTNYVRIVIPNNLANSGITESNEKDWENDLKEVSDCDYNKYLFVKKTDYEKNVKDHYPKYTYGLVWTGLTIPLKIHPSIDGHSGSLYNSNFNAGTFLGVRLGFLNDIVGATFGGFGGFSSLEQSASVNSAIAKGASENMAALNYGMGMIFDLDRKFQLGAVLGWDHGYGDLGKTYLYQNHNWFAVSLNFTFLDLSHPVNKQ